MQQDILLVPGIVVEGYRVASAPSKEYPYGTLKRQKPFFKARGMNIDYIHPGTINVSIAPFTFEMVNPTHTFRKIAWTDFHPPEDFSFSPCVIYFHEKEYKGFVYYPHPETKVRHFQNPSLLEVIAKKIPGIEYGAHLFLGLHGGEVRIRFGNGQ